MLYVSLWSVFVVVCCAVLCVVSCACVLLRVELCCVLCCCLFILSRPGFSYAL